MLSYWEQKSFKVYDHIVIGAGIVGLNTAIELRESFPLARILILERGLLPAGASSRNAGFACMGSVTELLEDLQVMGENEVVALFDSRRRGLEKLRARLGDSNLRYEENGSYELISEKEIDALERIDYLNELLFPVLQKQAFSPSSEKISEFGFSRDYTRALIENNCEGALDPGEMLKSLMDLSARLQIEIRTGAEVLSFEEHPGHILIRVVDTFREEVIEFQSGTLTLCTNAFTSQFLPDEPLIPGRGQIFITHPIPGLRFRGIFHFDQGYYYFREINGRILFGGGRNQDFETEETLAFDLNDRIQKDLEEKLERIIIPETTFSVDLRWSGIMAFGPTKGPVVKAYSDKIFAAFRMGGMGIALGAEVAAQVVQLINARRK
jgi:gamma-glutamylputrescine oxidase